MSPSKRTSDQIGNDDIDERIDEVDVSTEMQGSYLEYAYSVIYSRALPDARDGLKPVQRRILYMMGEMGLRPERGHVKSARVTGEVMGKLHPHGDSAIYDALVRMAQDFSLRVPLVDGHGNFGSLDDGPAAARYTEARLAAPAMAMVENLDEDVVDFAPNYDAQEQEPVVLPSAIPNLIVNGASGIAVGMATNMAPHNLIEVVGAAQFMLENPDCSLDELMAYVPGPDLPTGGTIVGLSGVREAYETGRGAFRIRAKVSTESLSARKTGLIVTELPYLVGPEKILAKIKDGVNSKKLAGISDVTDLSDRQHGLRIVIGIKTGFNPEAVLQQLYKHTPLEDGFSINNVALVDGAPRTLGLKEMLRVFLDHRIEIITRRSRFRLNRKKERLHLVEGLLIAIVDIDEVIQLIRTSDDSAQASTRLQQVFDLSHIQAEYILELRLRRLTKFSRIELESEQDELHAAIAELERILGSPARIRDVVATELSQAAERYGTERRTLLLEAGPSLATTTQTTTSPRNGAAMSTPGLSSTATPEATSVTGSRTTNPSLEIPDVPTVVYLSTTALAARIDRGATDAAPEATSPTVPIRRSSHDAIASQLVTTSRGEIGAVTNRGRLIRFSPVDLPVLPATAPHLEAGVPIASYIGGLGDGEKVLGFASLDQDAPPLGLGTKQGIVKRVVSGPWPKREDFEVIALKDDDEVVAVAPAPDAHEIVFVTSNAQLLHFRASTVRAQGAAAGGMAGISLAADAEVIAFTVVDPEADNQVVTISAPLGTLSGVDSGRGKVSTFNDFPAKGRATGGVRAHAFLKGEGVLSLAWVGSAPGHALAADGSHRALPKELARRDASGTQLDASVASVGAAIAVG